LLGWLGGRPNLLSAPDPTWRRCLWLLLLLLLMLLLLLCLLSLLHLSPQ